MYKNYFFLNRFIIEANGLLAGYKVVSAFSQEKERLIFELYKEGDNKYLEFSVNPGFPFINIKERFSRAKKNVIDFFDEYLPSIFLSLSIAESDRIIKLDFISASIYFAIRGKFTNIYLIDRDGNVETFKNIPDEIKKDFLNEVSRINFISHFNHPDFNSTVVGKDFFDEIRLHYPFIGKEIIMEAKRREAGKDDEAKIKILNDILNEIETEKPAVFIDKIENEISIIVKTFKIFPFTEIKEFENLIEGFNYYLSKKYFTESIKEKKKRIQKHIDRELTRVVTKINNVKTRIEKGNREEEFNKLGNLLLINISSIKKGSESIEVHDIYENNKLIKIKLNPAFSPRKNVDNYFDKSKNEKINFKKSKELYKALITGYDHLKKLEERFNNAEDIEDYNSIMKELKIKDSDVTPVKDDLSIKFKHYLIDDKYDLYVGKDSRNNDLLTTKFAKQNDYWFHARSVSGSHVVLRIINSKEPVPKYILKKTASIAAYHSKAKTSGLAPVSYTQKKYVVKRKGMDPGKVALLKEETLLVKPEIPEGCKYISNE